MVGGSVVGGFNGNLCGGLRVKVALMHLSQVGFLAGTFMK